MSKLIGSDDIPVEQDLLTEAERIQRQNLCSKKFEPAALWLPRLLSPNSNVMHIGASIGRHTYIMAIAAPYGSIHAFEPSPHTYPILEQVLRLHGLAHVVCHRLAVSNFAGPAMLSVPVKIGGKAGHSFGYLRTEPSHRRQDLKFIDEYVIPVDAIRLDDFVAEAGVEPVDLLRIDVEGSEDRVIRGARSVIERFLPQISIEIHPMILRTLFDTEPADLFGYFSDLGYRAYYLADARLVETHFVFEECFREYFFLHPSRPSVRLNW